MTDRVRALSRRRAATDALAVVLAVGLVVSHVLVGARELLVLAAYAFLSGTSTAIVTFSLTRFTGTNVDSESTGTGESHSSLLDQVTAVFTGRALEDDADVEDDTGWLIGRLENVLVLTLVLAGEYTALSIVFAAKSWVRREDTASENTTYYLAGTLTNFTYSVAVGILTLRLLDTGL